MSADELLRSGDIDQARAALVDAVRRSPSDQQARMFLFQLLALCGEWDKASAQLKALAQLSPEAAMLATVYNQAIEAEKARLAAFAGKGEFPVLIGDDDWMKALAASLQAFAKGDVAEGEAQRDAAFEGAPETPGDRDGEAFDWIADADGRFGPAFEAVLYGRWGLIPFSAVESIAFEGPQDLRDVIWAPAQIRLHSGPSSAVLIPARYPGSEAGGSMIRLGRETSWTDGLSGQEGLGQRLFSFDRGDDAGILSIGRLTFVAP